MRTFAIMLVLLLAGCATNDEDPAPTPPANNSSAMSEAPAPLAVAVALHNEPGVGVPPKTMGIDPARLELTLGRLVNLTVTNEGRGVHNLVIDGLDVATDDLDAGESVSIEFTPTEEGTFTMYCSIGGDAPVGHRGQGMVGEVVVS